MVAFVPTTDAPAAKHFYGDQLGLSLMSEEELALVFKANGNTLSVMKVKEFQPAPFTVLGWKVSEVAAAIADLYCVNIEIVIYPFPPQDELGVWSAPGGTKVARFRDPSGNILSLIQHPLD